MWIAPDARELVESLGCDTVEGALACERGELRQRIPERSIRVISIAGRRLFLKRTHASRPSVFIRALAKANFPVFSAAIERRRIEELRARGFRVPEVLAAGDEGGALTIRGAILLAELPGRSLEDLEHSELRQASLRLARELGEMIRRLQEAGYEHRDLYPCHVFHDPERGFGLIDLERLRQWPGGLPQRRRARELAALGSGSAGLTARHRAAFLVGLFGSAAAARRERALLTATERRLARLQRRQEPA